MLQRPFYQGSLTLLTLLAFAGGMFLLLAPDGPAAIEITSPSKDAPVASDLAASTTGEQSLIDLNRASARELAERLPGIGPVLSERIVAFRVANGPFQRADQLMQVAGIGTITYENVRTLITVGE